MFNKQENFDYEFYVIDDVREQTKVIEAVLKKTFKAKVTLFNKPEKLIKALEKSATRPDIIISDQKMPSMSGLQLRNEIHDRGFHIPFIFITTAEGEEIIDGDTIILSKPINVRELERYVRQTLNQS